MLRTKKRAKLCECKRCMGRPEHVRRVLFRETLEALTRLINLSKAAEFHYGPALAGAVEDAWTLAEAVVAKVEGQ